MRINAVQDEIKERERIPVALAAIVSDLEKYNLRRGAAMEAWESIETKVTLLSGQRVSYEVSLLAEQVRGAPGQVVELDLAGYERAARRELGVRDSFAVTCINHIRRRLARWRRGRQLKIAKKN